MKITLTQIVLIIVVISTGSFLIFAGSQLGWGLTWSLAGAFFISIGFAAILLSLAWVLPGSVGAFLRHPVVNVLILAMIGILMCATVTAGFILR
jgi:hypothetical protein